MPIYEYQCTACGHQEEFIQKVSDKPMSKCPACGKNKLQKQVSSTAFQLKGEGWYVTDFKNKAKPVKTEKENTPASNDTTAAPTAETKKSDDTKKE